MVLAWLLLLTGLTISAVAIYYSVVGLAAIFSAAVIPIIIMGSALEVGKLVCASWLKANWEKTPWYMKSYMTAAVAVLMLITSMGIFGFLSKAHNDQTLVSGDVQAKIAVYDEKIKTERDNIEAAKKALTQMDAQVDQMLGRTDTDKGAERAVQIRRNQAKERTALQSEIAKSQKTISQLQAERAPIAAEVRKVEAEVGPIKYIAKFIYGEKGADENMLEKAVTWVIVLIVIVFDPLAVIMLLAAQMTFGWARNNKEEDKPDAWVADVGEKPTKEELEEIEKTEVKPIAINPTLDKDFLKEAEDRIHETIEIAKQDVPETEPVTDQGGEQTAQEERKAEEELPMPIEQWNKMLEEAEKAVEEEKKSVIQDEARRYQYSEVTGDRLKPDLTEVVELYEEPKKKNLSYMTKDDQGHIQVKNREV